MPEKQKASSIVVEEKKSTEVAQEMRERGEEEQAKRKQCRASEKLFSFALLKAKAITINRGELFDSIT